MEGEPPEAGNKWPVAVSVERVLKKVPEKCMSMRPEKYPISVPINVRKISINYIGTLLRRAGRNRFAPAISSDSHDRKNLSAVET